MGSLNTSQTKELEVALAHSCCIYEKTHQLSRQCHEKASKYLPGGNTRTVLYTTPFPITVSHAKSCYLTTVDNIQYVDFLCEFTAGIYGHSHPVIKSALHDTLESGWNYGAHSRTEGELASIICERFPAMEMVRFVNSGTEANMMALATAVTFTGKNKILIFRDGYHGSTISGRRSSGAPSINLPHEFVIGEYNEVAGTKQLVESLPEDSLAAILVEPMLGSGGCYLGSQEFLTAIRVIATQYKALLIFDEVMTSRLGYHGLGAQTGVAPDLMTLGKWVGGGMSFGAFGGRRDIMEMYDPRRGQLSHPGTFNNNVFSMNAGIAGCRLLNSVLLNALNDRGARMCDNIRDILVRYHIDGEVPDRPLSDDMQTERYRPAKMYVKGVGSLMCIHFAGPDRELLHGVFFHHMLELGMYLARRGFIALSIEITEDHIMQFVAAIDAFCQKWSEALKWNV